jgi:Flp pilus assembly protein CpaB
MTATVTRVPDSPPGVRASRRSWRDPRLVLGLTLVAVSVVAVVLTVRLSDDRVAVWAVRDDVVAGTLLEPEHLVAVPVRLPDLAPYVPASSVLPVGTEAARDLAAGELLTDAALHEVTEPRDLRVVTLPVLRNQMPGGLAAGDRVDVYVVERDSGGEPAGAPRLVLPGVSVASVDSGGGAFGGTGLEVGVALSVPGEDVTALVAAQSRGTLTLVDVPVGAG